MRQSTGSRPESGPEHEERRPGTQGVKDQHDDNHALWRPAKTRYDKDARQRWELNEPDEEGEIMGTQEHDERQPEGERSRRRIFIAYDLPPCAERQKQGTSKHQDGKRAAGHAAGQSRLYESTSKRREAIRRINIPSAQLDWRGGGATDGTLAFPRATR